MTTKIELEQLEAALTQAQRQKLQAEAAMEAAKERLGKAVSALKEEFEVSSLDGAAALKTLLQDQYASQIAEARKHLESAS